MWRAVDGASQLLQSDGDELERSELPPEGRRGSFVCSPLHVEAVAAPGGSPHFSIEHGVAVLVGGGDGLASPHDQLTDVVGDRWPRGVPYLDSSLIRARRSRTDSTLLTNLPDCTTHGSIMGTTRLQFIAFRSAWKLARSTCLQSLSIQYMLVMIAGDAVL